MNPFKYNTISLYAEIRLTSPQQLTLVELYKSPMGYLPLLIPTPCNPPSFLNHSIHTHLISSHLILSHLTKKPPSQIPHTPNKLLLQWAPPTPAKSVPALAIPPPPSATTGEWKRAATSRTGSRARTGRSGGTMTETRLRSR